MLSTIFLPTFDNGDMMWIKHISVTSQRAEFLFKDFNSDYNWQFVPELEVVQLTMRRLCLSTFKNYLAYLSLSSNDGRKHDIFGCIVILWPNSTQFKTNEA